MAEYTIPKPYRDFCVTDPYVGLQKEVEELQEYSYPRSQVEYGSILHGENTLPDKEIPVKVESKNILVFPYESMSKTANGGTLTAGEDGGITGSGTPTGSVSLSLDSNIPLEKGIYTLSANGTFSNMTLYIDLYNEKKYLKTIEVNASSNIRTFNTDDTPSATSYQIGIVRTENNVEMTGTVYPQLERGDKATSYALYQPEGTPVTVTTCGKNLLNIPSYFSVTKNTNEIPLYLNKGSVVTMSCSNVVKGGENSPRFVLFDKNNSVLKSIAVTTDRLTFTLTDDSAYFKVWSNGYDSAASEGITSTMDNLMMEFGYDSTTYETYTESITETTVGSEIVCKQLNSDTNIFSNNIGVSLYTQFVLYNEKLFNDKLTAFIGLFSERPTNICDYDRLYISIDKSDNTRSAILPAGKIGSIASNWIYI